MYKSLKYFLITLKNSRRAYAEVKKMIMKNMSVKELMASIYRTNYIDQMFKDGLEMGNDRLAISAMEELIRRGDTDKIVYGLNEAFDKGLIVKGSALATLMANSLVESTRGVDPFLNRYGKSMLRGEFLSPKEWAEKSPMCYSQEGYAQGYTTLPGNDR